MQSCHAEQHLIFAACAVPPRRCQPLLLPLLKWHAEHAQRKDISEAACWLAVISQCLQDCECRTSAERILCASLRYCWRGLCALLILCGRIVCAGAYGATHGNSAAAALLEILDAAGAGHMYQGGRRGRGPSGTARRRGGGGDGRGRDFSSVVVAVRGGARARVEEDLRGGGSGQGSKLGDAAGGGALAAEPPAEAGTAGGSHDNPVSDLNRTGRALVARGDLEAQLRQQMSRPAVAGAIKGAYLGGWGAPAEAHRAGREDSTGGSPGGRAGCRLDQRPPNPNEASSGVAQHGGAAEASPEGSALHEGAGPGALLSTPNAGVHSHSSGGSVDARMGTSSRVLDSPWPERVSEALDSPPAGLVSSGEGLPVPPRPGRSASPRYGEPYPATGPPIPGDPRAGRAAGRADDEHQQSGMGLRLGSAGGGVGRERAQLTSGPAAAASTEASRRAAGRGGRDAEASQVWGGPGLLGPAAGAPARRAGGGEAPAAAGKPARGAVGVPELSFPTPPAQAVRPCAQETCRALAMPTEKPHRRGKSVPVQRRVAQPQAANPVALTL